MCCRLLELDEPGLHPLFVKQVVTLAMDRRDREREMASGLLSSLHPQVITPDQVCLRALVYHHMTCWLIAV